MDVGQLSPPIDLDEAFPNHLQQESLHCGPGVVFAIFLFQGYHQIRYRDILPRVPDRLHHHGLRAAQLSVLLRKKLPCLRRHCRFCCCCCLCCLFCFHHFYPPLSGCLSDCLFLFYDSYSNLSIAQIHIPYHHQYRPRRNQGQPAQRFRQQAPIRDARPSFPRIHEHHPFYSLLPISLSLYRRLER